MTILHVDGSKTIVFRTKIILLGPLATKTVEAAATVEDAKTKLLSKKIDVGIFDINLPDGSGLELLEWTKRNFPEVVTIMFTNNSEEYFRTAARKSGADYFIDKSLEFENLPTILTSLQIAS